MNKWRETTFVTDSEDEIPGSVDVSGSSDFTPESTYMSRRKKKRTPTIIEATDSEDENKVDLEDVYDPTTKGQRINYSNNSASTSHVSSSEIAASHAHEETASNVDPLIAQQTALKTFELQQSQKDLLKTKNIYHTVNQNQLPDRVEKLRLSIEMIKEQIQNVSQELDNLPKFADVNLSAISIKDESSTSLTSLRGSRASFQEPEVLPTGPGGKKMGEKAMATFEAEKALTIERIEHLQTSLNKCPAENVVAENSVGLRTHSMPHQKHALAWMLWRENEKPPGGLLADDMGLGKTFTMISLIVATKGETYDDEEEEAHNKCASSSNCGRHKGGTLVVCPSTFLEQ